jgi:hypothetical protein
LVCFEFRKVVETRCKQAWEAHAYVKMAIDAGYSVDIRDSAAPWRLDAEELSKRNCYKSD